METERLTLKHKNLSNRFLIHRKAFSKQFCNIYDIRLDTLSSCIKQQLQRKYQNIFPIIDLHKLLEENYEKCIIIGTVFKELKLKPSLVKQLTSKLWIDSTSHVSNLSSPDDLVYIENQFERYLLSNIDSGLLVTGLICAVLVSNARKGTLFVHEVCFAGYPPQISFPLAPDDAYIVFISGLNLSESFPDIRINLLINWISGTTSVTNKIAPTKIAALIIAGNSISNKPEIYEATTSLVSRKKQNKNISKAIEKLDVLLTVLCKQIDVYILPSKYDPSDYVLPQNPMHHCMFPNSSQYNSLHLVSNPYECEFADVRILGSSGECVRDVLRCSKISDSASVLENCLIWRHLAPTAPDTLACFPFEDEDPFIIKECPQVLFAGNQKEFSLKVVVGPENQSVCLLCVPEFCETQSVCVLNLRDLNCECVEFKI